MQVDYMFLRDKAKKVLKTVLCAYETFFGEGVASEVYTKGRGSAYAVKRLEQFLQEIGCLGGCSTRRTKWRT